MSRTLLIYDEIGEWGTKAKDVAQFLIDNEGEDIDIRINSPGGSVFDAYAIYNNIRNTKNVTIYIDGIAASAAAIIALCGKPLKMADNAQLMLHSASTAAWGNKKQMEEQITFLDSIDTTLASMIATKMGKEVQEIKDTYFDGADHWLTAQECKDMGICELWRPSAEDRVNLQKVTACLHYDTNINQKYNNTMLQKLQTVKAFMNCHTEDEAMVRINDMVSKNAELTARVAELEKVEKEFNELKDKLNKAEESADAEFIDEAVKDGRITEEMKPTYEKMMAADRESTRKVISSLAKKKAEKVEDFINKGSEGQANSAWDKKIAEYKENLNKNK